MKILYAIHKYDVFMFFWLINTRFRNRLVKFCRYLSSTADGELYILFMAVIYYRQGFESIVLQTLLLALVIERPLYFILKNSFKRNRPAAVLENFRSVVTPSDQFSFPSGHTSAAFMMATLAGHFYPPLLLPLYAWAVLIGFSRVTLGVHFPTDTAVGGLMGISIALFSIGQIN